MAFAQHLILANFTCKFGENLVLLDLATSVVLPAFTGTHKRSHGNSTYFFHDVEIIDFSTETKTEWAIAGRLVKQTVVSRDQIFEGGQLVKDSAALATAPTSFFVLLLSNHKLLYVRENSGAPTLSTFATTAEQFIKREHISLLDEIYIIRKQEGRKMTRAALFEALPLPTLTVTPLSTEASISSYVERFRTINTVEIQLLETNHEFDFSNIFGGIREIKSEIGAEKMTLKSEKAGEIGLNKGEVAKYITRQAEEGNSRIILRGKDIAGERFVAENESFNVSIPIETVPASVKVGAGKLVDILTRQISKGVIVISEGGLEAIAKLKKIFPGKKNE